MVKPHQIIPTEAELREAVEHDLRWVQACCGDSSHKYWLPSLHVFLIHPETGELTSSLTTFADGFDERRYRVLEGYGAKHHIEQQMPRMAVLSIETWRSSRTDCEPRHDPQREEMRSAQTIDEEAKAKLWERGVRKSEAAEVLYRLITRLRRAMPGDLHTSHAELLLACAGEIKSVSTVRHGLKILKACKLIEITSTPRKPGIVVHYL